MTSIYFISSLLVCLVLFIRKENKNRFNKISTTDLFILYAVLTRLSFMFCMFLAAIDFILMKLIMHHSFFKLSSPGEKLINRKNFSTFKDLFGNEMICQNKIIITCMNLSCVNSSYIFLWLFTKLGHFSMVR